MWLANQNSLNLRKCLKFLKCVLTVSLNSMSSISDHLPLVGPNCESLWISELAIKILNKSMASYTSIGRVYLNSFKWTYFTVYLTNGHEIKQSQGSFINYLPKFRQSFLRLHLFLAISRLPCRLAHIIHKIQSKFIHDIRKNLF